MSTEPTATEIANTIADKLHALVYAARDIGKPGEAYAVAGALVRGAQVLPQLLDTVHQAVDELHADDKLAADAGKNLDKLMATVVTSTDKAILASRDLYAGLNELQQALSAINYRTAT